MRRLRTDYATTIYSGTATNRFSIKKDSSLLGLPRCIQPYPAGAGTTTDLAGLAEYPYIVPTADGREQSPTCGRRTRSVMELFFNDVRSACLHFMVSHRHSLIF